jgi:hypothetical protein
VSRVGRRIFGDNFCFVSVKNKLLVIVFFAIFSVFVHYAFFVRAASFCPLLKKQSITGTNHNLQLHNNQMSMTTVGKNVLTASHTKYCVTGDFSTCVPLFLELG